MALSSRQRQFTVMVAELITFATVHGYGLRFGDALRSTDPLKCPDCKTLHSYQELLIYNGRSADPHSKHLLRLAIDFIIERRDGEAMTTEDYTILGAYWEGLGGTWGGRWRNKDLGHFELDPTGGPVTV